MAMAMFSSAATIVVRPSRRKLLAEALVGAGNDPANLCFSEDRFHNRRSRQARGGLGLTFPQKRLQDTGTGASSYRVRPLDIQGVTTKCHDSYDHVTTGSKLSFKEPMCFEME